MKKIFILDTTLRDGEQSPGAAMNHQEKMRIARALEKLRVDVIEAGFPIASEGDFKAVHAIAHSIKDSQVCGLARALRKDIERTSEALKGAASARIHTFIGSSQIHMENKLHMAPEQVLDAAVAAVKMARSFCETVEFSPEDAARAEIDFLCTMIEKVISAGARVINIPDTVGYAVPEQFGALIATLRERVPNADKVIFSVHCHNDLGLAVANSLAAIRSGAEQVECTINGLGERAGNASLEEIVMTLKTRRDFFDSYTAIDTPQIVPTSRLVSSITGFPVQPNKAIVGANAFAHTSGIHQDGILKYRQTYEIMKSSDVGWAGNCIVLSKLSGRNALRRRLGDMGIFLEKEELNFVFKRFKELADKKSEVFDDDLQAIITEKNTHATCSENLKLESLEISSSNNGSIRVRVGLNIDGKVVYASQEANGSVEATYKAIEKLVNSNATLRLYAVNNITTGCDSQGEVTVRLSADGRVVNGLGIDLDIVAASAKAYINALNRLHSDKHTLSQLEI